MKRRAFFSALASMGAGGAIAAAAPAPVDARGLEPVQVYCPHCSRTIHPMHLGVEPPFLRRELLTPRRVTCFCGHEYTAAFVREV